MLKASHILMLNNFTSNSMDIFMFDLKKNQYAQARYNFLLILAYFVFIGKLDNQPLNTEQHFE